MTFAIQQQEDRYGLDLHYLLERIKVFCLVCLISRGEKVKHASCSVSRNLCFKCFAKGHFASSCSFTMMTPTGVCNRCFLPAKLGPIEFHDTNAFGSACSKKDYHDLIRSCAWLIFRFHPEKMKRFFDHNNEPHKFFTFIYSAPRDFKITWAALLILWYNEEYDI